MARAGIGQRLLRIIAAIVGVVVLLVGLTLLLQTGAVSRKVKDLVVPRASAALGRELTVKDAKLRVFPRPRVVLSEASVAGRPGEPPLVQLGSLDVTPGLWRLLASLGKDVQVDEIRLVKPVVSLVRARDGTWNYEGLGKGAEAPPPAQQPPKQASSSKFVVNHFAIEDGSVQLLDRQGSRQGGGQAALALSRIDMSADHVGVGEPLEAKLSAAIAGDQKNFRAQIGVSRLPESLAALAPGSYPQLTGSLALEGLDLARVRAFLPPKLTGIMTGGRVDADAKLGTQAGKYAVGGSGKLSQVRLRGEPAQGAFELHAVADPASGAARATIDKLVLKGPGVDLGGRATIDAKPLRVRFALAGPLLDLGQVMGYLPEGEKTEKSTATQLTAEQRRAVEALDVQGTVDIQKVVKGAFVANDFKAAVALEHGLLVLRQGSAGFFDGRVDAAGTRVDLAPALPRWDLKAKLQGVDLGHALTALSGSGPVEGKMSGALDLDGAGVNWPTIKKALTGQGSLSVKQGALTTADIGDKLATVAKGLSAVGQGGAAKKLGGAAGRTDFGDLAAQFTVKDGAMTLSRPLSFKAPFGTVSLGGKIGLGGELALQGTANLTSGVSVPLGLGGTLTQPSVSVNAGQAVAGAAQQKAREVQKGVEERAKRSARRGLGDVFRQLGK